MDGGAWARCYSCRSCSSTSPRGCFSRTMPASTLPEENRLFSVRSISTQLLGQHLVPVCHLLNGMFWVDVFIRGVHNSHGCTAAGCTRAGMEEHGLMSNILYSMDANCVSLWFSCPSVHVLCFWRDSLTKLCGRRKEMSRSEKEQDGDVEWKRVDGEELMCKQFPRRVAAHTSLSL